MKIFFKHLGLWSLALLITMASAIFQRLTGPTYPVSGKTSIMGSVVTYELYRSHSGEGDQPVKIIAPDKEITGLLVFRRYPTRDEWIQVPMTRKGNALWAFLPHQPPAGKVEYHIELYKNSTRLLIPKDKNVIIRFRGQVPLWALLPHVIFMFLAMLLSTRTGIQALHRNAPLKAYMWVTFSFLVAGGFIFGPIVQKFAFGEFWTGIPFGSDLTDSKTLIALIAWIAALIALQRAKRPQRWALGAAIITLLIFLIPHSMHGSQLDYSTVKENNTQTEKVQE